MSLDATRIVDMADAMLQSDGDAIEQWLAGAPPPPGLSPVSDEAFREFVLEQLAKYPPQLLSIPIRNADGTPLLNPTTGQPMTHQVEASPWILQLSLKKLPPSPRAGEPLVTGGPEILARIEATMSPQAAVQSVALHLQRRLAQAGAR